MLMSGQQRVVSHMLENLPAGIGRVLREIRSGLDNLVFNIEELADTPDVIIVSSPAFGDCNALPVRFTEDGQGVSPPLRWTGVPADAVEVALLIEDADSPTPNPLVNAIVWRLRPEDGGIEEGAMPQETKIIGSPAMGVNSYLRIGYLPPDPPPGHGLHRYAFQVFALKAPLTIETSTPGRTELVDWLRVYTLAKGMLIATYERD
jgi:Raf kinase inhibitor-like YbhB/YbcL family protein